MLPTTKTIEEVSRILVCDAQVCKAINNSYGECGQNLIAKLKRGEMLEDNDSAAYAIIEDAFHNDAAKKLETFEAEQSKGAYDITIWGIKGAYFVQAPEYDEVGIFTSLEDARIYIMQEWGEFLT